MESIAHEIYEEAETTIACTVPLLWAYGVGQGTTVINGTYTEPYKNVDLGEAGQYSALPSVRFLTARVPYAREGDELTLAIEIPDEAGAITVTPTVYKAVGVEKNRGRTDIALIKEV